jgi:hypothetical protein
MDSDTTPTKEIEAQHKEKWANLEMDIENSINRNSMENYFDVPDFLLAEYAVNSLRVLAEVKAKNDIWHSPIED